MGTLISFLQKIGLWKKPAVEAVYPEHPLNAVNATKIIEDRLAEIASEKKVAAEEKKVTAKEIKSKVPAKKVETKPIQPKTPVKKPALKRNPPKPKV